MISVRIAEPEDIPQVAELWVKMVKEIYPGNSPRADWWVDICKALMSTACYCIVLAESADGKIVGFIDGLAFPEPSTGMMHGVGQHMYISPEYRNTSVALKIYRRIMQVARHFKVKNWEFFCAADNTELWTKKGYIPQRIMMRRRVADV